MVALRVFTLCDYASTRNNLLTIVGGGVTNLWAPQIPTAPNLWVGVLLEIGPDEAQTPHEVRLTVTSVDKDAWAQEFKLHEELFTQLAHGLPPQLADTKSAMEQRLAATA